MACESMIRDEWVPKIDKAFAAALGRPSGSTWRIEIDPDEEEQQTVLFHYPTSDEPRPAGEPAYLRPYVRLEMGARGEHWPSIDATIQPYSAEDFPDIFKEPGCTVKVVAAERTFWEKQRSCTCGQMQSRARNSATGNRGIITMSLSCTKAALAKRH